MGGVPRPLKASELAQVMNEKYGNVVFVAIDCDAELKYPKGQYKPSCRLVAASLSEPCCNYTVNEWS